MIFSLTALGAVSASKPLFLAVGSVGTVVLGGLGLSTYKKQIVCLFVNGLYICLRCETYDHYLMWFACYAFCCYNDRTIQ